MPSVSGGALRGMPSQGACDLGVWRPLRHPPGTGALGASLLAPQRDQHAADQGVRRCAHRGQNDPPAVLYQDHQTIQNPGAPRRPAALKHDPRRRLRGLPAGRPAPDPAASISSRRRARRPTAACPGRRSHPRRSGYTRGPAHRQQGRNILPAPPRPVGGEAARAGCLAHTRSPILARRCRVSRHGRPETLTGRTVHIVRLPGKPDTIL
jgi:hypothetical protein